MSNKLVPIFVLLASVVLISGCIFNDTPVESTGLNLPQKDLPQGIAFMGIHEAALDIGGSSMNATEGVYRNSDEDLYIQIIRNDDPDVLVARYKERYKEVNYKPFEDVSINGHKATKIKDYFTKNGQQVPVYTLIWADGDRMIIVGASSNPGTVAALATATGY